MFVVSLAYSVFETARSQPSAYFVTPTRAWEFTLGGIMALVPAMRLEAARWPIVRRLASWVALFAIVASSVILDGAAMFPGWVALVPVVATGWLLYVGDDESSWSPQYLSHAGPLQAIGDWSYAIYLWHWPLVVAWPQVFGPWTSEEKILVLVLSVVLAAVTKRFIEDPVRQAHGAWRRPTRAFAFMAAGMAIVLVVSIVPQRVAQAQERAFAERIEALVTDSAGCFGAYALLNDCADPYAYTDTVDPAFSRHDEPWTWDFSVGHPCTWKQYDEFDDDCTVGLQGADTTIALVGDSHARSLLPALVSLTAQRQWAMQVYQQNGCSGFVTAKTEARDGCAAWSKELRAELLANAAKFDLIIMTAYTRPHDVDAEYLRNTLAALKQTGTPILIVGDSPGMPRTEFEYGKKADVTPAPVCVENAGAHDDACAREVPRPEDWLLEAAKLADIPAVSLTDLLCADGRCHVVVGGTIVYTDAHHLATTFARTLTPWISEAVDDAMGADRAT